jgi:hypothetical protein
MILIILLSRERVLLDKRAGKVGCQYYALSDTGEASPGTMIAEHSPMK